MYDSIGASFFSMRKKKRLEKMLEENSTMNDRIWFDIACCRGGGEGLSQDAPEQNEPIDAGI